MKKESKKAFHSPRPLKDELRLWLKSKQYAHEAAKHAEHRQRRSH